MTEATQPGAGAGAGAGHRSPATGHRRL